MVFDDAFKWGVSGSFWRWELPSLSDWRKYWATFGVLALFPGFGGEAMAAEEPARILALGDSLTAGYMLDHRDSFPAKLEAVLKGEGYNVVILNAGVSGDTTQGGLSRLGWALGDKPDYAIVELGANDALRGIAPDHVFENLDAIMATLKERGIPTFLIGMKAPRNMGEDYVVSFDGVYPTLQKKYQVPLFPFFLEGVLGRPSLTLPDGMHPSAEGVDVMVRNVLPMIREWLGAPEEVKRVGKAP